VLLTISKVFSFVTTPNQPILLFTYEYEQTLTLIWSYILIYNASLLPIFIVLFQLTSSHVKTINFLGTIGAHYTLTKILIVAFLSAAGIPPFVGFFSKIFIFTLLCNSYFSFLFLILFIFIFIGLYFYMQTIRFLNTSNQQNCNSVFDRSTRIVPAAYYLCFPLTFSLVFGFLVLDDVLVFVKWCFI
jgi:NADH-quinone oxidoreductase subunit N